MKKRSKKTPGGISIMVTGNYHIAALSWIVRKSLSKEVN